MKKYLIAMVALVGLATSSCDWGDPMIDTTTVPKYEYASSTLSGVVIDIAGKGIKGATLTMGDATATTGDNGEYCFNTLAAGKQAITVSAPGYYTNHATINVPSVKQASYRLIWNTVLDDATKYEIPVQLNQDATSHLISASVPNNNPGKIKETVTVPVGALANPDAVVYFSPIYTVDQAVFSRAAADIMILGTNLSCNKPDEKILSPIFIDYELDESVKNNAVARVYLDGKWVVADSEVTPTGIRIKATEFASYALFVNANEYETIKNTAVEFETPTYSNIYGRDLLYIDEVPYTHKSGIEYNTTATNNLEGLFIEYLARKHGVAFNNTTALYPFKQYLAIGYRITFSGTQTVTEYHLDHSAARVKATNYGNISITTNVFRRGHEGGGA